jgi:hypothetical protein
MEDWSDGMVQGCIFIVPALHHYAVRIGGPGRTCTRNLRVRSAALCLLSYEA